MCCNFSAQCFQSQAPLTSKIHNLYKHSSLFWWLWLWHLITELLIFLLHEPFYLVFLATSLCFPSLGNIFHRQRYTFYWIPTSFSLSSNLRSTLFLFNSSCLPFNFTQFICCITLFALPPTFEIPTLTTKRLQQFYIDLTVM